MSRLLLFIVCLGFASIALGEEALTTPAALLGQIHGVQLPEVSLVVSSTGSQARGTLQRRTCHLFAERIVIETDSGQVGPDEIRVRKRARGRSQRGLCQARTAGDVLIESASNVLGLVDNLVVVIDPDGAGSVGRLAFFDVDSGRKLFEEVFDSDRPLVVERSGGAVSLKYLKSIPLECQLDMAGCWEGTLRKLGVAATIALPPPVCPAKDGGPRGIDVFVPVHVDDVRHPRVIYESGIPVCEPTP